ncbi:MAG TPA: aminotransferase class I/II-fold pyridoxal phosphate-dependent enzyme, partial [Nitrosopumilaceae archaeon]|nr:aminotransferase class I/II-fold pyridoxal phosphate-dependent enzyme [Nitrosopumilaceae archaeon]
NIDKTIKKEHSSINTIDEIISYGVKKKILHLTTKDKKLMGNALLLNINGREKQVVNFGSCSYLGLEFDPRLKSAAQEAIENYGTQFSASRAYISTGYYAELEELFNQLFGGFTVVAPTTTLAHISAIPVLVEDTDAIILDHQVHHSVQTAINIVKTKGVHTELIRHNKIDILEGRIQVLRQKHKRIWYMADGIYSMYGDQAPVSEIFELMNKYPELHFYVDDAHGMSCFGKNGRGYVLSEGHIRENMVLVTSLAKGFATGGGVIVFPTKELARKIRTCGGPLITSGPLQPANLGAGISSAKIHLSDEIYSLQDHLNENIKFANLMIKKSGLPLIAESDSPVFFIGLGLPKIGYKLVKRMLTEGHYLNLGIFPAVPIKNTGIRFTITKLHSFKQIEKMVDTMSYHFNEVLREEGFSIDKIYHTFRIPAPTEQKFEHILVSGKKSESLQIQHTKTIFEI